MCSKPIEGPWILLNRYAVGSGYTRCLSEVLGENGYEWNMADENDPDGDVASGYCLHWPKCAIEFIEQKMMEGDIVMTMRSTE
jgi:hypothetical protein